MGALDGTKVCELVVGNFLLHKSSEKYERKNLAQYRDDWLAIFENVKKERKEKKTKKKIKSVFVDSLENMTVDLQFSALGIWIWKAHHIVLTQKTTKK